MMPAITAVEKGIVDLEGWLSGSAGMPGTGLECGADGSAVGMIDMEVNAVDAPPERPGEETADEDDKVGSMLVSSVGSGSSSSTEVEPMVSVMAGP